MKLWSIKSYFIIICLCLFSLTATAFAQVNKPQIEKNFQQWLENDFWPIAKANGISRQTFDSALKNVKINWKLPDLVIPGAAPKPQKPQSQAEFSSPARYFDEQKIKIIVDGGKKRKSQYEQLLSQIKTRYGVPENIILAIWGRETAYGSVKIPYDAFEVLATKAFMATRKEMFQNELLSALIIVEKNYINANELKSSWAGALGQPQFMPSSYLKHAVDFDGDGHRDIWQSVPDSLASIANYLKLEGWDSKFNWGYEVILPQSVSCALEGPDMRKSLAEWQQLGVKRADRRSFSNTDLKTPASLLMPAGRFGPAFLVTPNFYVIKSYNMSDLYAVYIGHVADGIGGTPQFFAKWQNVDVTLRSDVLKIQQYLQKQGYDIGKADGLAGFKTRRSIGQWQQKNGLAADCYPSQKTLKAL
ncbi:lytic murein transglycosylase [Bartonella sp. HY329]|uniref:lytic murein transglycosylase n=1 Tax=unclassified Bartonella TaxID=2645622 RepID=UPI0021C66CEF|nr:MULTISPECIES: lytic murein transglycosylase [unclassified Bartonella]UXM95909.1 lytic murein transglycosylase [Bartonella sp. HY329]UXN10234.1 lytic murein transglycosylase [Bartonella sp. HY328]